MDEAITWDEYIGLARRYIASGMLDGLNWIESDRQNKSS